MKDDHHLISEDENPTLFTDSSESTDKGKSNNVIGAEETKAVLLSRMVFFVTLVLAAAGAGYLTHSITSKSERNEFESSFAHLAEQVSTSATKNADNVMNAMIALGTSLTTVAGEQNDTIPFATFFDFPDMARPFLTIGGKIPFLYYAPVIWTTEKRAQWEHYVATHKDDVIEAPMGPNFNASKRDDISPYIYHVDIIARAEPGPHPPAKENEMPWMPLWQISSRSHHFYFQNLNGASFDWMRASLRAMNETKAPAITFVPGLIDIIPEDFETAEPQSFLLSPVFGDHQKSGNVEAALFTVLPWGLFLLKLLPEGTPPLTVVISNTCGQVFTYVINGPYPSFIGNRDIHDYDELGVHYDIPSFQAPNPDSDQCSYFMDFYPTKELEESYQTKTPFVFTSIVVGVFLFTSVVFCLYDMLVERRQRKVLHSATATGAIVNDLFPEEFQDRLFDAPGKEGKSQDLQSKPLADFFPDATVMFAEYVLCQADFDCVFVCAFVSDSVRCSLSCTSYDFQYSRLHGMVIHERASPRLHSLRIDLFRI